MNKAQRVGVMVLVASLPLAALAAEPRAAIHPMVMANSADGAQTEFFVVLREQADLEPAHQLASKEARGRFVHRALVETAQTSQESLRSLLDARGISYRSFVIVNAILVTGGRDLINELAARPEVARIEPNPEVVGGLPPSAPIPAEAPSGIEWGIDRTNAPVLWGIGFTGQGIVVGGQDTGVDWDHPAIKAQYRGWSGAAADHNYNWHDSIHGSGGNPCGYDSVEPCDDHGHGTHTIGTAVGDDGGANQIGMAPGARWIGCRNMDQGVGTPARYIECMEWFLAPYPIGGTPAEGDPTKAPDVTNNSWACPPDEGCAWDTLKAAVEAQRAAGIMTVVSAGNEGSGCGSVENPPALYDAAYSIGSTTSSNGLSGFSSRGPTVANIDHPNLTKPDVVAPGSSIRSSVPGGSYATWSGTSMAAPHVAGAVALIWSARPDLKGNLNATETLINSLATRLPAIVEGCGGDYVNGPNNSWGYGLINLEDVIDTTITLLPQGFGFEEYVGDGNGFIEQGERIRLQPIWSNPSAFAAQYVTGVASSMSDVWIISDDADYGTIPSGESRSCDASGNCYVLIVNGTRPGAHWDLAIDEEVSTGDTKTWSLHVGESFTDVARDYWSYPHIEAVLHNGITAGCTDSMYCPSAEVSRWQMAVFLSRAMLGGAEPPVTGTVPGKGDYDCTTGGTSVFADVPADDPGCRFIHFIASEEITGGCTASLYCPLATVDRWQMGVFMAKSMAEPGSIPTTGVVPGLGSYDCTAGGSSVFGDVAPDDPACRFIHFIAAEGVTVGCGGGNYCPSTVVGRDQMAVFLTKAFDLTVY